MALLLDNDVIHKLAQLDLLTDATRLLIEEFGELKVLDTLKFKFCHPKRKENLKKKYGSLIVDRIEDFLNSGIIEVSQAIQDVDLINAMISNIKGLDEGELRLLQALLDEKEQLLFTGDKRFLQALAKAEILQHKLAEIQGKFVCLEQIICLLIKHLSFEKIKIKYLDGRSYLDSCQDVDSRQNEHLSIDGSLRTCFSKRENAVESEVLENLVRYINELRNETANLLSTEIKFN